MMSQTHGLSVANVGEFGLIELLMAALPPETVAAPELRLGIGDDAAVLTPNPGHDLVITTDSLVEAIHFRLDWTDWASLGHKALAVNLSDLAAMGASPRLAVVSLGLRGTERVDDLRALYQGLGDLARRTGTLIVGGDIVRSPTALMISVTAIGEVETGSMMARAAARPGDLIAVSGAVGASAAGLRLLARGVTEADPAPTTAPLLIAAHLRPEPRVRLGLLLRKQGVAAAMDLSDGLLGDLPKILAASNVRALIDVDKVPIPAAVRALFPDEWMDLGTRGGEDYELLFTAPPEVMARVIEHAPDAGATITVIGEVLPPEGGKALLVLRDAAGGETGIESGAFDHFR